MAVNYVTLSINAGLAPNGGIDNAITVTAAGGATPSVTGDVFLAVANTGGTGVVTKLELRRILEAMLRRIDSNSVGSASTGTNNPYFPQSPKDD